VSSSVVRRRGGELAVLRALGMTSAGLRAALGWQATTLSVIGLAIGVPVGVALGRLSWRVVADHTPLVFAPPLAVLAVLLAVPATIGLSNLIAVYPGWRAGRLRPSDQLRHE
jgi:ABC-type lipoprotein release transport system permease subunit